MRGDVDVQEVVEDRVRDADEEPRGEDQAGGPDDELAGEEDLDVGPGGEPDLLEGCGEAGGPAGVEVGLLDLAACLELLKGQRAGSVVPAGDLHDGLVGLLVSPDRNEELGRFAELQDKQAQQGGAQHDSGVGVPAVSPASVHAGGAVCWVGAGVVWDERPRDQRRDGLAHSPPRSHGRVEVLVLGREELEEDSHVGGDVPAGGDGGEKHEDAVHGVAGRAACEEAEERREDQGRVEGDFPANQVGTKPKQNRARDQPGVEDLRRHGVPAALHLVVHVRLHRRLHHLHLRVHRVPEPGDAEELHVEPREADLVDRVVHKVDLLLQRHVAVLHRSKVLRHVRREPLFQILPAGHHVAGRLSVCGVRVGHTNVVVLFFRHRVPNSVCCYCCRCGCRCRCYCCYHSHCSAPTSTNTTPAVSGPSPTAYLYHPPFTEAPYRVLYLSPTVSHCLPPTIYLLSVSPRSVLDASCAYLPRSSNCCKITVATRVPKTMQPVASPPIRAWPACPTLLASRLPAPDPPLAALPVAAVIHCGGKHALSTAMDCPPGMCAPNRDIEARAEQSRAGGQGRADGAKPTMQLEPSRFPSERENRLSTGDRAVDRD